MSEEAGEAAYLILYSDLSGKGTMTLDLEAPIIPGQSAGGYHIGQIVDEALLSGVEGFHQEVVSNPHAKSSGLSCYRSDSVDIWVAGGAVTQIGVHGAYRGRLLDQISLGMTIDDLERLVGPCTEDSEDNLVIVSVQGLCFDIAWRPDHVVDKLDLQLLELRFSPITWFFVFRPQKHERW